MGNHLHFKRTGIDRHPDRYHYFVGIAATTDWRAETIATPRATDSDATVISAAWSSNLAMNFVFHFRNGYHGSRRMGESWL
jgi:hypothetical protein